MSFDFDYHKNPSGFLGWALVNMLAIERKRGEEDFFENVSKLSARFRKVKMCITLNGLEVDVPAFLASLEVQMEHAAQRAAAEKLAAITQIGEIEAELEEIRLILKQRKWQLAQQYGISLDEDF